MSPPECPQNYFAWGRRRNGQPLYNTFLNDNPSYYMVSSSMTARVCGCVLQRACMSMSLRRLCTHGCNPFAVCRRACSHGLHSSGVNKCVCMRQRRGGCGVRAVSGFIVWSAGLSRINPFLVIAIVVWMLRDMIGQCFSQLVS